MKKGNSQNGYTLVEIIVSMSIFTLVIGMLFSVLVSQNNFFSRATGRLDTDLAARKVMDILTKELRVSNIEKVDIWNKPLDETGCVKEHFNGRSITFKVPVDWDGDGDFFDAYGIIEWGAESQLEYKTEYYWDNAGHRVMRRIWDESLQEVSETIVAENIAELRFRGYEYDSATKKYKSNNAVLTKDIVEITVTAEKTTFNGVVLVNPLNVTITNQVGWRN